MFSYSTTVFRLMEKTYAIEFVADASDRPYQWGPWEYDTHDGVPAVNEKRIEILRSAVANTYLGDQAARKAAMEEYLASKDTKDSSDATHDEENHPDYISGVTAEAKAASRKGSDADADADGGLDEPDEGDENSKLAKSIPKSVRAKLLADYVASGRPTQYKDKKTGTMKNMSIRYIKCYRMAAFPHRFRWGHIICDEAHLLRKGNTSWSRGLRLNIKLSYQGPEPEKNPMSLVLVSATPAINDISDYRGLSSLF